METPQIHVVQAMEGKFDIYLYNDLQIEHGETILFIHFTKRKANYFQIIKISLEKETNFQKTRLFS